MTHLVFNKLKFGYSYRVLKIENIYYQKMSEKNIFIMEFRSDYYHIGTESELVSLTAFEKIITFLYLS